MKSELVLGAFEKLQKLDATAPPSSLVKEFSNAIAKIIEASPEEVALSYDNSRPAPLRRTITGCFVLFYEIARKFSKKEIETLLPFYEEQFEKVLKIIEGVSNDAAGNFGASIAARIKLLQKS